MSSGYTNQLLGWITFLFCFNFLSGESIFLLWLREWKSFITFGTQTASDINLWFRIKRGRVVKALPEKWQTSLNQTNIQPTNQTSNPPTKYPTDQPNILPTNQTSHRSTKTDQANILPTNQTLNQTSDWLTKHHGTKQSSKQPNESQTNDFPNPITTLYKQLYLCSLGWLVWVGLVGLVGWLVEC